MKVQCYRTQTIIALGAIAVCALTTLKNCYNNRKYSNMLGSKSLQFSMHKNASEPLTARGGGILTVHSACRMARWVYKGDKQYQCKMSLPQPKRSQILQNASQFQENDTIYVPFTEVERFVNEVLDGVSTSIVVISGDLRNEPIFSNTAISKLLNHTHILKWFCQNLFKYGGVSAYHPKVAPFPYGLNEREPEKNQVLQSFKKVFFESIQNKSLLIKPNFIFVGPLALHNKNVPEFPGRPKV